MYKRPSLKEYVMAKLVAIAIAVFLIFSLFIFIIVGDNSTTFIAISFMALAFIIFIYLTHCLIGNVQDELILINRDLNDLKKIDKIEYNRYFLTKEFEGINENLTKILKDSKKREDVKQRYNAKLKLKNKQRGDMISAIAHEFRNPIASIMGYSQTLQEDTEIPFELQKKFLHKIYNNGNKIESLLSRLILWNKIESGNTTIYKSNFDLSLLLTDIKTIKEEKYNNRKVIINVSPININADKTLIEIVLKNLIENALKYSKDDVEVTIEDTKISIRDYGVGIAKKDIDKVTKKFYRAGTHSWDNSMGLGLSIVKTILLLHNSKLEITSKVDVGSTFSFTI